MVSELLSHLMVAGVETAGVVIPGVSQSLVHQLVAVAIAIHLGPVVFRAGGCEAAQSSHGRGWVGCTCSHDGRPLVRPVRVLLHVLSQISLLRVALPTVRTNMCLQMLRLLVLGDMVE